VQSHPHQKWPTLLPFGREEPTLDLKGGFQCIRDCWEGTTEGITNRLEDVATTLLYGASQDLVVAGQSDLHDRGVSLPELGGASYIGEQEGESACWRAGGHYPDVFLVSLKRTL
jgi:hypothetical protein